MLLELNDITRAQSPKRRNSDIMNADSAPEELDSGLQGAAASRSVADTPFRQNADQEFGLRDRLNSHSEASTSDSFTQQNGTQQRTFQQKEPRQLTVRAVLVGLAVGSILCFSNTYFGLQTGWVTMGSLQSAILGFGIFKLLERFDCMKGFTVEENVIVQTTSVATATMPLAAGLVGVIPAMSIMTTEQNPPGGPVRLSYGQLVLWSLALAFLGVFCAVPLRTQTILKEKLRFPSGTATANVIRTLHAVPDPEETVEPLYGVDVILEEPELDVQASELSVPRSPAVARLVSGMRSRSRTGSGPNAASGLVGSKSTPLAAADGSLDILNEEEMPLMRTSSGLMHSHSLRLAKMDTHSSLQTKLRQQLQQRLSKGDVDSPEQQTDWEAAWQALLVAFAGAGLYTLIATWLPAVRTFPVATWLGLQGVTAWGWEVTPSMGYIGQGMIMGPKTAFSMLAGALAGYALLGPFARQQGWAPGPIGDWRTGATGWVLWVSLAIMLGDSITSLSLLLLSSLQRHLHIIRTHSEAEDDSEEDPVEQRIPTAWWVIGLPASGLFCTALLTPMLGLPLIDPLAAVVLALLVAVLAVRALGQTDLNPVSGVGKLSQGVFALIAPGQVVPNLVAGAIAEAGAQQAGDMMQDFKTAHLLGVRPRAQFYAMLIGSFASVFVSVGAYALYTSAFQIPGPEFPAPTAQIWLDMAELVNGGRLPSHVIPFCAASAALAAMLPLIGYLMNARDDADSGLDADPNAYMTHCSIRRLVLKLLPSGIGFAVGMYVAPKYTIPRVIGSLIEQGWLWSQPNSHAGLMVVVASGLVLGEGTASILTAVLTAVKATAS